MPDKDYYAVLGVAPSATQSEIRRAFRLLAQEKHPDKDKSPGADDRFKEINEAYQALSNATRRQKYDAERQTYEGAGRQNANGAGAGRETRNGPGASRQRNQQSGYSRENYRRSNDNRQSQGYRGRSAYDHGRNESRSDSGAGWRDWERTEKERIQAEIDEWAESQRAAALENIRRWAEPKREAALE